MMSAMMPRTHGGRGEAMVLVGDAPMLVTYLAQLRAEGVTVVVEGGLDERTCSAIQKIRRPIVILGDGVSSGTKILVALRELRLTGATLLAGPERFEEFRTVAVDSHLSWADVAWVVPETYRLFNATAEGRVHFARNILTGDIEREWLARACLVCPNRTDVAARALGLSRASLDRRMSAYGMTWHSLSERLTREVCIHHAARGDSKLSAMSSELGCSSATELSRRLKRTMEKVGARRRLHDRE